MNPTPEQQARQDIDAALEAAGWILQNRDAINFAINLAWCGRARGQNGQWPWLRRLLAVREWQGGGGD